MGWHLAGSASPWGVLLHSWLCNSHVSLDMNPPVHRYFLFGLLRSKHSTKSTYVCKAFSLPLETKLKLISYGNPENYDSKQQFRSARKISIHLLSDTSTLAYIMYCLLHPISMIKFINPQWYAKQYKDQFLKIHEVKIQDGSHDLYSINVSKTMKPSKFHIFIFVGFVFTK